jgi:hypothetical protein
MARWGRKIDHRRAITVLCRMALRGRAILEKRLVM